MPEFESSFTVGPGPKEVWRVISDFANYPEIIREIKEAGVEASDEESATVAFALDLPVRRVTYTLRYSLSAPRRLAWEMVDSNTLTSNAGEWRLTPAGEGTQVTYRHRVEFPSWMAWAVTDAAFRKEMDKTLGRFRAFIEGETPGLDLG